MNCPEGINFVALMQKVFDSIPSSGEHFVSIAHRFAKCEPYGYGESNAKLALLQLQEDGRVHITDRLWVKKIH